MSGEIEAAIAAARERISAFELTPCGLAHERVRTVDPFRRVSLCRADVRGRRLACGHTLARVEAARALARLSELGAIDAATGARLAADLQAIGDRIHRIDHAKGDAEKAAALEGTAAARARVTDLIREHDACVEQLRAWRGEVLGAIAGAR